MDSTFYKGRESMLRRFMFILTLFLCYASPSHGMTAAEIITRVRVNIKDQATTVNNRQQFSDSTLLIFLNDGQREANTACWLLQNTTSFNLVNGAREYALPIDFLTTNRVLFNNVKLEQTSLNQLDAESLGWLNSTGVTPQKYYIYRTTTTIIGFVPKPSSSTVAFVNVFYLQQPIEMTSTSDTPWSGYNSLIPYHTSLEYYATYRAFRVLEENDLANLYFQEWTNSLALMQRNLFATPDFNPGFTGQRK